MRMLRSWLVLLAAFAAYLPSMWGQHQLPSAEDQRSFQRVAQLDAHADAFEKLDDSRIAYFQFTKNPSGETLKNLTAHDIHLLSYHRNGVYLVRFPKDFSETIANQLGIEAFAPTHYGDKLSSSIRERDFPTHALAENGGVRIAINFHEGRPKSRYLTLLENYDVKPLEDNFRGGCTITGIIDPAMIEALSAEPLVHFVDVVTPPVDVLNNEVRTVQQAAYVNSAHGKNLNGSGVVVGIGDGGELGNHLDFQDRVINYANGTYSSFGDHGDHVAGIVGGGGLVNSKHRGVAAAANVLIQKTSLVTYYADDYFADHGMVLTNNSYGTSFNCNTNGSYNYTSQNLDWQMNEFPEVLHVFAAGNSGSQTCDPYPPGYFTMLRYYQVAKNVLTVGNVTDTRQIKSNSSRGPAADGRLKPEICGIGTSVVSTGREYNYTNKSGTSMSAPAVTGTLALLYESYRDNNNGENPTGALVKAVACNTADDLGNAGPDYTYGYGLINARRAIETIEQNNFLLDSISDGETNIHTITVPAGTKEIKVMLYWSDKEADPYPTKALINDLDAILSTPGGSNYAPWVLNHNPANVADVATRKVDTLNNIEQVTLLNPAPGEYSFKVEGSDVAFGPQDYVVTWEFVTDQLVLTCPVGGEYFTASEVEVIQWDTDMGNTSTFTVEYSIDGGANWILIDNNVAADERSLFWTVPNVVSQTAHVRVVKNTGGQTVSNSVAFNIADMPSLTASPACGGKVLLEWTALTGADHYKLYQFDGINLVAIDTTSNLTYTIEEDALVSGDTYWFSIAGKTNSGQMTRQAVAQSCVPDENILCPWANDLLAESILVKPRGRIQTTTALDQQEAIVVKIKNIGNNSVSGADVSYRINNGPVVTEFCSETIASGASLEYTFNQTADLSAIGTYDIDFWVTHPDESHPENDSLLNDHTSEQIDNEEHQLANGPIQNDFAVSNDYTYTEDRIGLSELEDWDFETSVGGTLKIGSSGGMIELLIDEAVETLPANYTNGVVITANLENHLPSEGLLLDFSYSNNNLFPLQTGDQLWSKVFARGSDTDTWLEVYVMNESATGWHEVDDVNIMAVLQGAGQSLSTSFQIKFEEYGKGLLVDDFGLHQTNTLPVELLSFTATKRDGDALLEWRTATEENNARFEIQVATSIEEVAGNEYEVLGQIPGAGTTSSGRNYQFLDDTPDKLGSRYYRLKQVDLDGTFTYSDLRQLEFLPFDGGVQVYPNPFTRFVSIRMENTEESTLKAHLYHVSGQLMATYDLIGVEGEFAVEVGNDVSDGAYFLQLEKEGIFYTLPVMKVSDQ